MSEAKEIAMRPIHEKYRSARRKQGLYDPAQEHDACGVGFVVNMRGEKSHEIVRSGLEILVNLTHRGACGCDPLTGDGAGILTQIPHEFFAAKAAELGITLPAPGDYGVGTVFLPRDEAERRHCEQRFEAIVAEEGQAFLGWRDVPIDNSVLGHTARDVEPVIRQMFIARGDDTPRRHARVEAVRHSQAARQSRSPAATCRRRSTATSPACRRA